MNGEELQELLSRYVEHRKLLGYRQTELAPEKRIPC